MRSPFTRHGRPEKPETLAARPGLWKRRSMRLSRTLYKNARRANDVEAVMSGNPKRMARRTRNKAVGRAARKSGLFRMLFK